MGKHIKGPQESYVADKVSEKWFDSKEIEKIKQAKKEQLLRQIDNYCGITGENFDYKKCEKLIAEIIKILPSEKEHFERAKEMFKKIEMQNIRQNQYNGGLLCDLAYTKKENLDLMILEPLLILKTKERDAKEEALYHRHLEGEEYPNENLALQREVAELREEVLGLGNTIYLIKTLSQKGFKIETMEQRNLENNLSAFYIENKSGEGYFVIRGTTDFFGKDAKDNNKIFWGNYFAPKLYSSIKLFEEIVPKDKKVIVYGHSLGGYLAQGLALKKYENIKEVMTYDAPGLPKNSQKSHIINRLFQLNKANFHITNILQSDTPTLVNKFGKRIGKDLYIPNANQHQTSVLNNAFVKMTAKEETTLSEKNQNLLYEQQKERDCNTPFDFDRERCAKSMEELKEAFQKNPKILKRLMETEKYMEAMETKSEIMTLALASRIGSYDIPQLGKKYEKFFKISNKEKFRYIVDVFFHAQNTGINNEKDIMGLLDLYQLEKKGYPAEKIGYPKIIEGLKITVLKHHDTQHNLISLYRHNMTDVIKRQRGKELVNEDKMIESILSSLRPESKNIILGYTFGGYLAQKAYLKNTGAHIDKVLTFHSFGITDDDMTIPEESKGDKNRQEIPLLQNKKPINIFHIRTYHGYENKKFKKTGKRLGKNISIHAHTLNIIDAIEEAPIVDFGKNFEEYRKVGK